MSSLEIYVDGACKGNPGPAGIGYVFYRQGEKVKEFSKPIGQATNNIAEYMALIYALEDALGAKADDVKVYTDSELVFKQIIGQYKVKHPVLKPLFEQAVHLIRNFEKFHIEHVLRERNKEADRLASRSVVTHKK